MSRHARQDAGSSAKPGGGRPESGDHVGSIAGSHPTPAEISQPFPHEVHVMSQMVPGMSPTLSAAPDASRRAGAAGTR